MENNKLIEKYTYRVEWSEEDKLHIGRWLEFPSLAAHGGTVEGALKEIERAVEESINWIREENEKIPEPFRLKKFIKI